MPRENAGPKWNKADAPIVRDGGGMFDRQRARLAAREAQRKLDLQITIARAAELELKNARNGTRTKLEGSLREDLTPAPDRMPLKDRVTAAASTYVSCLSMEVANTDRLKELLDELEDLPRSSAARRQLEPTLRGLIACRDFEEGIRLFEQLPINS